MSRHAKRTRTVRTKWVARLAIAATSASIGLVATGAVLSPASADTPVKVGWWNFASGGGQAAPAPDTKTGGLRVGVSSSQPLAIGAVEYSLPRDGSATLELAVTSITSNANAPAVNAILACPTKDDSWKAGDNQDSSTAPAFDCDRAYSVGRLSADQSTMTFQVNGSADISDGVLSLAIVPAHSTAIPYIGTDPGTGTDLTPPFVIDFDKPSSNSFVTDGGSSSSSSSDTPSSSSAPPPSDTGSTGTSSTPSFTAPPPSSDVSVPPATTTDPGTTPVVAPQQPATTGGTVPAAAAAPAKTDNSRHDLLLVLLILLLFAILYTQNMQQRAPRRVAATAPPGQPGTEAATLPVPYPVGLAPRGLGRFSKPRAEAARPLI